MTWRLLFVAVVAVTCFVMASGLAQDRAALVEDGRKAFVDNGCYGCHTAGKFGTPIGPDLSHVGGRYPASYLERWLHDPAAQRPSAHMPKLELSEAQARAVAAFLSSLP